MSANGPAIDREFVEGVVETAFRAGQAAMRIYATDFAVSYKDDQSPVTAADHASEAVILGGLAELAPGIPVIAEESVSEGRMPETSRYFFLVDPLDGTREFMKKNGEFTINIALIEAGVPKFGLIYAPALSKLYLTLSPEEAVSAMLPSNLSYLKPGSLNWQPMRTRTPVPGALTCVVSRSHQTGETEAFMQSKGIVETKRIGSSLKFCLVAAGEADVYPRLGPTWEWDTAAGHAIVNAAGGCVLLQTGEPLIYGKRSDRYLNPGFIVWGKAGAAGL